VGSTHFATLIAKRLNVAIVQGKEMPLSESILIDHHNLLDVIAFLKQDPDSLLDLLLDIFSVKHLPYSGTCQWRPSNPAETTELFYHLRSSRLGYRLDLSVIREDTDVEIPSLSPYFTGATALETELLR
jgi:NADH:ubiquinone oxidoreductase subunit C